MHFRFPVLNAKLAVSASNKTFILLPLLERENNCRDVTQFGNLCYLLAWQSEINHVKKTMWPKYTKKEVNNLNNLVAVTDRKWLVGYIS